MHCRKARDRILTLDASLGGKDHQLQRSQLLIIPEECAISSTGLETYPTNTTLGPDLPPVLLQAQRYPNHIARIRARQLQTQVLRDFRMKLLR